MFKRSVFAFGLACTLLLALTGAVSHSALASPSALHQARTNTRADVQQQVTALLHRVPGGKQIAWNEVSYNSGSTLVSFTASSNCDNGFYCAWHETNYGGVENVVSDSRRCVPADYIDLTQTFGEPGVGSYQNNSPYVVHWYTSTYRPLGGTEPGHGSRDTTGNPDFYLHTYYMAGC